MLMVVSTTSENCCATPKKSQSPSPGYVMFLMICYGVFMSETVNDDLNSFVYVYVALWEIASSSFLVRDFDLALRHVALLNEVIGR